MTPAFLNRFDIIELENQIIYCNKEEIYNLITILWKDSITLKELNKQIINEKKENNVNNSNDNNNNENNNNLPISGNEKLINKINGNELPNLKKKIW